MYSKFQKECHQTKIRRAKEGKNFQLLLKSRRRIFPFPPPPIGGLPLGLPLSCASNFSLVAFFLKFAVLSRFNESRENLQTVQGWLLQTCARRRDVELKLHGSKMDLDGCTVSRRGTG